MKKSIAIAILVLSVTMVVQYVNAGDEQKNCQVVYNNQEKEIAYCTSSQILQQQFLVSLRYHQDSRQ